MRVTIVDIAREAKVSPSTVSRVLSDDFRISKDTRKKVLEIIDKMDYHPNAVARSLVNKSANTIGLIIQGISDRDNQQHPCFIQALQGATFAANKNSYDIRLSSINNQEEENRAITEYIRGGSVDGIILIGWQLSANMLNEIKKNSFPFVSVGRVGNEENICYVDNNNFTMGYEVTSHLIKNGCRKIAFLRYSGDFDAEVSRMRGYIKALGDMNIPFDDKLVIEGAYHKTTGHDLMKVVLAQNILPDGIIATDDFLAYGAMRSVIEKGYRIPEDIAVAGFNNALSSSFFLPSLTSVEVNSFKQGEKAVEVLLSTIRNKDKSISSVIIPGDLIIRESSQR